MRENADLDSVFFGVEPVNSTKPLPKRPRKSSCKELGKRDRIRRRAFRILSALSDLCASDRLEVLRAAIRLNRA
jgi:hypothetical protein